MIQSRWYLSSKKSRRCNRSPKREREAEFDHRDEGRRDGKSRSELGPEIRVRFPRVEHGRVMSSLIVFSLGNKRNQSKGEGWWASWLDLGAQEDM